MTDLGSGIYGKYQFLEPWSKLSGWWFGHDLRQKCGWLKLGELDQKSFKLSPMNVTVKIPEVRTCILQKDLEML